MMEPFSIDAAGIVDVMLSGDERRVLAQFAGQLVELSGDEPVAARLYPPAFPDDPLHEAEFQEMTRASLQQAKKVALERFITSMGREPIRLDEDDATAWLGVLNDARLVLGTALSVTEEMDHRPKAPHKKGAAEHNLYLYLSGLQEELIAVLSAKEFPNEEESWD